MEFINNIGDYARDMESARRALDDLDATVVQANMDKIEEGKLNEEQVKKIEEDGILNMEK